MSNRDPKEIWSTLGSIIITIFAVVIFLIIFSYVSREESIDYISKSKWLIPVLGIFLLVVYLKFLLSFLLWKITINDQESYISFRTFSKTYCYRKGDITEWGVRDLVVLHKLGGRSKRHFFECTKKDNSKFIYPLSRKFNRMPIALFPRVSKMLDLPGKRYEKIGTKGLGFNRIKYVYWYFLSV